MWHATVHEVPYFFICIDSCINSFETLERSAPNHVKVKSFSKR